MMKAIISSAMVALMVITTATAATAETLTLACAGTNIDKKHPPALQVSPGIIIDFSDGTLEGFTIVN